MLICIEGTDASGKETQSKMLKQHFDSLNKKATGISYPDYDSDSSALVKMYLNGDFGASPSDVSPKVASIFYACDRYASYNMKWKEKYQQGEIIIADRYATSNLINQASKIDDLDERRKFIEWNCELEYSIFKIPTPDVVVFLNMPFDIATQLMKERANKISGQSAKDIHESDSEYLKKTYENAISVSKMLNWIQIDCVDENENLKTVEEIHNEIVEEIMKIYE